MTSDAQAARAVLLLAKASLGKAAIFPPVRLMPQNYELSIEAAVLALESLEKPVQCVAYVENQIMVLRVTPALDSRSAQMHDTQKLFLKEQRGVIGSLIGDTKPSDLVGLAGAGELLVLPLAALQAIQRDYVIMMPLGLGKRRATGAESAQGLSWVVTAGSVEGVSEPELQDLLRTLPRVDTEA